MGVVALCNNVTFFEDHVKRARRQRFRLPAGFAALRQDLGGFLQERRKAAGLKQEVLAEMVQVTRESLSRIESGASWPRPETLDQLMAALELNWTHVAIAGESNRASRIYEKSVHGERFWLLGRDIRTARLARGWSLRKLSEKCGLSAAQLSRIERGEVRRGGAIVDHPDDSEIEADRRRVVLRNKVLAELVTPNLTIGSG